MLKDLTREKMIDDLFEIWDRVGRGGVIFEKILPHYIKSHSHNDETETEVRQGFHAFCKANKIDASKGFSKELFRSWLMPLTDVDLATRHVTVVLKANFVAEKEHESKTPQAVPETLPEDLRACREACRSHRREALAGSVAQ